MSEELRRKLDLAERAYLYYHNSATWRSLWTRVAELALEELDEVIFDRALYVLKLKENT